jgi:hypothetical protein
LGGGGGGLFIKADIEGAELQLLEGCRRVLATEKNLRMVLCTYHRHNHAEEAEKILTGNGFRTEFSKGYMLFWHDREFRPPYLRRGVIRAFKNTL